MVKFRYGKCLASLNRDEEIVYSPNKYRETEGIKEIELKELLPNPCPHIGIILMNAKSKKMIMKKSPNKRSLTPRLSLIRNPIL